MNFSNNIYFGTSVAKNGPAFTNLFKWQPFISPLTDTKRKAPVIVLLPIKVTFKGGDP